MTLQKTLVIGLGCWCLVVGSASTAAAQAVVTSFGELGERLRPGKTVYVTDDAGRKVKGKVVDFSASSLRLSVGDRQEDFPQSRVLQISEQRRNTGHGAAVGFLVGGGLGLLTLLMPPSGADASGGTAAVLAGMAMVAGMGAGVGALIGTASTHERPVYLSNPPAVKTFRVVPFVSKHGTGLAASVRF